VLSAKLIAPVPDKSQPKKSRSTSRSNARRAANARLRQSFRRRKAAERRPGDLDKILREVIDTLAPCERRVRDKDATLMSRIKRTKKIGNRAARTAQRVSGNGSSSRRDANVKTPRLPPATDLEEVIQRFTDLYDFAPIGYVSFDRSGRIAEVNLATAKLLGRSRDLLVGRPFALFVAREDSQVFFDHLLRCRSLQGQVESELRLKNAYGETVVAHLSSTPTASTLRQGTLLYQTAIVDLTQRRRTEEQQEALYQFVQRQSVAGSLRDIYDAALEAILSTMRCDRASILLFDHRDLMRFVAWRGLSETYRKAVEGHSPWKPDAVDPQPVCIQDVDLAELAPPLKKTLKAEGIGAVAFIPIMAKGKLIGKFMAYYDRPHVFTEKETSLAISIARQLTLGLDRRRAEDELRKSKVFLEQRVQQRTEALRAANRELQREIERRKGLEGEILAVSDREQQRLGQELHDGLCQQLTAVGFMARATALRLRDHRVVHVDDLEKMARLINNSVSDARNIARDLHKEEVDAAGFVQALRSVTEREMWKTRCRLELKTEVHIDDDRTASQLYRILREALINAHKHAKASKVVVEVRRTKNNLVFSVTDNGVGFTRKTQGGRGLGFHIMEYRARSIGARLSLGSPANGGARVVCSLPNAIASANSAHLRPKE